MPDGNPSIGESLVRFDSETGLFPRDLHNLAVDVVSGRKPRLEALRDLTPEQLNQMAAFFRRQAMEARPDVQGAFEFNMERARFLQQGGGHAPGNLNQFREVLNAQP